MNHYNKNKYEILHRDRVFGVRYTEYEAKKLVDEFNSTATGEWSYRVVETAKLEYTFQYVVAVDYYSDGTTNYRLDHGTYHDPNAPIWDEQEFRLRSPISIPNHVRVVEQETTDYLTKLVSNITRTFGKAGSTRLSIVHSEQE